MADGDTLPDEGLTIVLTPLQLAAMLDADHISPHEMLVNRLWAVGGLAFSAVQLVGAGALLLAPEPTLVTKAGGVVLGAHGLDQGQAAARQLWTGRPTEDLTQMAGEAAARQFGADRKTAFWAGVGLDVAVPLVVSGGLGAARLAAIRAGRISLAAEELAGGHTLERHVAASEEYLRGSWQTHAFGARQHRHSRLSRWPRKSFLLRSGPMQWRSDRGLRSLLRVRCWN